MCCLWRKACGSTARVTCLFYYPSHSAGGSSTGTEYNSHSRRTDQRRCCCCWWWGWYKVLGLSIQFILRSVPSGNNSSSSSSIERLHLNSYKSTFITIYLYLSQAGRRGENNGGRTQQFQSRVQHALFGTTSNLSPTRPYPRVVVVRLLFCFPARSRAR